MKTAKRSVNGDWRSIENEKEKYAAYLCSREWSILKEAVKERSGGTCERCKLLPGNAVHHLTYERKYNELLDDLQNNCNSCHEFTHAKSNFDPSEHRGMLRYLLDVRMTGNRPIPYVFLYELTRPVDRIATCLVLYETIQHLCQSVFSLAADGRICQRTIADVTETIETIAGFQFPSPYQWKQLISRDEPWHYRHACQILGIQSEANEDECAAEEEE